MIIDFIYSGDVEIGMQDIEDVLDAATHLQMRHIVNFCTDFLIEQVNAYSILFLSIIQVLSNICSQDKSLQYKKSKTCWKLAQAVFHSISSLRTSFNGTYEADL